MSIKTTFKTISLLLLLFTSVFAQSDIIINEIMYDPITGQPEWVEIYNRSSNTYDLANWKLSDALNARTITTKSISIGPGEFVVLTQDSSIVNFFNIPSTVIPLNSWSGLNNGGDEVVLIDNTSQTIDSLKYTSSWGDADKSIERIDVNASSTDRNNWAVTFNPNNGTPGFTNSVAPKENDVAVNEIVIVQNPPIEGENLSANVEAKNHGTKTASSFSLSLYNDSNFNSIAEPGELISSKTVTNLASGDSSTQVFSIGNFSAGNIQLIGVANLSGDQLSANDTLITSFTILPQPPPFNAIVINELMYAPPTGHPEWVEIFNRSNITYDLANWQFSDGTSTSAITTNSISIAPDEYIIITEDSSIVDFYNTSCKIIVMNLPSLNNSGDRAVLMNEYSIPVDSFTYSSSWGGSNNKSLERIDVDSPSTSQANWGSSVNPNNATPGRINSLSPKNYDLTVSNISISPDPAFEDIDIAAVVEITNLGEQTASSFSVNLYNDLNFDDTPQSNELISSFSLQNLASGNSMEQLFGLGMLQQGTLKLIGVANFGNDEDNSNDTLISEFTINPPPPPFNSIVINETMYAPSTGQPEWVELYNNSNTTFNLADWKFADGSTESIITSEQITIAPSEYLVLSKDASIQNYFNINAEVIVMNLPSLNNSGDRAILMDSYSIPIDSLTYSSSWGGTNGKSLERIDFNTSSNDPLNWGTSQSNNNATPGYINSLSQKNFDLAISRINISPSPAIENTNLSADIKVMNYGLNTASSFTVSLYNDQNFNSIADPNELINSFVKNNLASLDSVIQNFDLGSFSAGSVQLIATIDYANDEAPANNKFIHEFTIYPPPPPFNSVVINEIMYSPFTDQPEWVELYNNSNVTYDLANWKFADGTGESVITIDQISIAPGEYLILTKDASIESYFNYNATTIVMDLPNLNNSGDRAILMDNFSIPIDSLTYSSSWGGTNGRSLERISFDEASNDPQNWGTSISTNNATPGDINSLSPKNFDLGVTSISILPLPPIEGTDLNANLKIINFGSETADSYTISLYNDLNFNSVGDPKELINSFVKNNLASLDSVIQNFELGSFSAGSVQLIATIDYANDEAPSNNKFIHEFTIISTPPDFNVIVINEIMYSPPTGQPEWIEIYNRSNSNLNLVNWKLADNSTTSTITVDNIDIAAAEYVVISNDSSILNFYNISARLIVADLPVLNDGGDRTILMDGNSIVIDSLTYSSSWGGTNGRSLERIDFDVSSNNPINWGTSVSTSNATPGDINSISPKEYDLGITAIAILPSPPVSDQELTAQVSLKNFGSQSADNFTIRLYNDENNNSIGETNELVGSANKSNLASYDSVSHNFSIGSFSPGSVQLIANVNFNNDENTSNNNLVYEFSVVAPPPPFNAIVINEIMYAPASGQPEWIEIYNRSNTTYNLIDWKVSDAASTVVITTEPLSIAPGEFVVLAKNESIYDFYSIETQVIVLNLPTLNNSGDKLVLSDNNSSILDSLTYKNSWGGTNGRSLERENPDLPSHQADNWSTSTSPDGATPGKENSVVPRQFDLAVTYFNSPNSFLLANEPTLLNIILRNAGLSPITGAGVKIYYDVNNDLNYTENEIIEEITDINLQPSSEFNAEVSYTFSSPGEVNLLAAAYFAEDVYPYNDSLYLTKEVIDPNVNRGQIVINEILYAPDSPYPEWIELLNTTDIPQQLRSFSIADSRDTVVISTQNILLPKNSFLVLSSDSIITQLYDIPSNVIIKDFPSLNNSGDRVMLLDNYDRVIDSLEYSSDWGGDNGNSLERINPFAPSSSAGNWTTSTDPANGTPGRPNSTIPKEFDVELIEFNNIPKQPVTGDTVRFTATVSNKGTQAVSFPIELYSSDKDSTKTELLETVQVNNLSPGEERFIQFKYKINSFSGDKFFVAEALLANDEDLTNNLKLILVASSTPPLALVINEIMYNPSDDEPEWIELYNRSENSINLKNWSVSDILSTPSSVVITTEDIFIAPGEYIILSKDSGIFNYHPNLNDGVILVSFANLNNSTDGVIIYNRFRSTIDSVLYTNDFPRKIGHSIERISFGGNSNDANNWDYSISSEKSTPGEINSRTPKNYDLALDEIFISPEFPTIGEEITISMYITNAGLNDAANYTIIFDADFGVYEEIQVQTLAAGRTDIVTVSSYYQMPLSFTATATINYSLDENVDNNTLTETFFAGYTNSSLVINEIMYDPDEDEPEWIELYNRSLFPINLNGWSVSDVLANPELEQITSEDIFVEPGEYVVLSKDSGIYNYHPGLTDSVLLVPFANLNNTVDGVVIYDRLNVVIDSAFYSDDFPSKSGYSIERLSTEAASNAPDNWNYSVSPEKGTPGFINSRIPKDQDLVLEKIIINPEFPELGNTISISAAVLNAGIKDADSYTITFISAELNIDETISGSALAADNADTIALSSTYNMPESFSIAATISYQLDENLGNNIFTKTFYSGYAPQSILVNEVMYDPNDNGTEWVEFVNVSSAAINLRNWMVSEKSSADDPTILINTDILVNPGDYIIVADDTSGNKFTPSQQVHIFEVNFGELNSTEDVVTLYDFRGAIIDSLEYFSSWGGGDGFSLERISLQSPTNLRSNWLSSIVQNGSTPGATNSTANISPVERKQIVINEIMFEPESGNSEFVELFNTSDQFVEIANWSIEDESKNNTTLSKTTFAIAPNSYFVIAADSSILVNYPELKEFDQLLIANKNMSLNNSDDLLMLFNSFDEIIDSVFYNSAWHNSRLLSTKNKSLERINPFLDGNDRNNWSTSVALSGATPGKANSIYIDNQESGKTISVTPNPFSPDGDGYEDFTIINYKLPKAVSSIQIKVFDSKGRKVRTINENNIYNSNGSIIFDGYNDDGQPLKIGIYILFIEAIDNSSGTTDTFKEVVVVARKL